MAVTLKEVAELAGVSRSAVSRCFTEGASVSAKTRARVVEAAEKLGYHPNALASSLTTGRTKLIGLVSNNFHNPVFLEVFDLFTRMLQDRGLRPLLVNLSDETDPTHSLRMLRQYSVDAVIVASSTLPVSFADSFHAAGVPVVHAFGRHGTVSPVPVVGIDNRAAGRLAAEELRARGYTDIGFMGGPEDATSTQDRLAGFRDVLGDDLGLSFAESYSYSAGHAEMARLIGKGPLAQAYFCGDDVLSIGAIGALRAAGRNVPADVGLLGLNDMPMAAWPGFDLTTIRQPIARVVEMSVDNICALLAGETPHSQILPCRIIERGSLAPK
ncbi:transcriptional regulator [Actibacterium mucosum KCTC 23349]|uniref:Transcriptional regulator n=1 Tax=Actibacterium mucosum KCTC 23349 TaxID=1454373 RepID=A0A037ZHK4_9RHOB|nr:LacI family DNA-binding transcriptional regulator [Actibacterium mucosum]KAJ55890.1 transcriptional regulator [Actibacterium mucosum KCTC 23349]